jgi:hypothetical protein
MNEFVERVLESEKESLLDYLHGYCDNPLEAADDKLIGLFADFGVDRYDTEIIRNTLDYAMIDAYFNSTVPKQVDYSIWIDISEIEVDGAEVPEECADDFTFTNPSTSYGFYLAYYYVGYGLTVEYSRKKIIDYLQSWNYRRNYHA